MGLRTSTTEGSHRPLVNAGKATCARCHNPIHAGEEWHLDHNDDRAGYLGVSHSYCNLRAAADKSHGRRPSHPQFEERPYKWSRRWFDDPPVGTIILGGERVQIYIGNGEWQPLDDTETRRC